jgi:uncharacterized OB-fold protein
MAGELQRPLPVVTLDSRSFWTGGARSQLLIYRCSDCQYWVHPPVRFCPQCESRAVAPQVASGRAVVASYTVNHQAWLPGMEVPYVLALVEIEEQPDVRVVTNIVNCPVDAVHIGMKVKVTFQQHADIWLPLFEPAEGKQP